MVRAPGGGHQQGERLNSDSTTEQRQLLDKRRAPRYAKLVRGLALASYDHRFGGKCHSCATQAAMSNQLAPPAP
eukprot:7188619-Pyramimonas_sp.AAC.1